MRSAASVVVALVLCASARAQTYVVNVEVDYMVLGGAGGHSHQPSAAEMSAVVRMFACHDILLNIDVDDAIEHVDTLGTNAAGSFFGNTGADGYKRLRDANFDRAGDPDWIYCIFGHRYDVGNGSGSSGLGETPGDDMVVTMGGFTGGIGTSWDRAATFAHELGHCLSLTHAGSQSSTVFGPFKPNYASIMSYQYQLAGVKRQMECIGMIDGTSQIKNLDYSNGWMPSMDESALLEQIGLGIRPTDWDCSGVIEALPVAVVTSNRSARWCTTVSTDYKTLTDNDDWTQVRAYLASKAARAPWHGPSLKTPEPCISAEQWQAFRAMEVDVVGPGNCPNGQPAVTLESCVDSRMIWVDATAAGVESGIGDEPYDTVGEAVSAASDNSVLYLQPGATYTSGGATVVIDKPLTLSAPQTVIIDP